MLDFLIGGLQKSSLIDYPAKIAAVVFTQGCNFACPYCHNPELITSMAESKTYQHVMLNSFQHLTGERPCDPEPSPGRRTGWFFGNLDVLDFLKTRVGKLDAVVITGGEPTLQKGLEEFMIEVKSLGFLVKLDTNGSNPEVLKNLLDKKLVDYVAMDIKAPIEKYPQITCSKINTSNILKSIELLKQSDVDYEFRTTVVKSQLEIGDFEKIGELIKGAPKYYLQKFVPTKTLNKSFMEEETYSNEEFEQIKIGLEQYVNKVFVR